MREHGRGLDGRMVWQRAQTGCGHRRRERGHHGAWLTRCAGTSRPGRRTAKPTAQIEPARFSLVKIIVDLLHHNQQRRIWVCISVWVTCTFCYHSFLPHDAMLADIRCHHVLIRPSVCPPQAGICRTSAYLPLWLLSLVH